VDRLRVPSTGFCAEAEAAAPSGAAAILFEPAVGALAPTGYRTSTALPPEPVITATRLPRGSLQKARRRPCHHVVEIAADYAMMTEDRIIYSAEWASEPVCEPRRAGQPGTADLGNDDRLAGDRGCRDGAEPGPGRQCSR
jgi:hypothetical protein